MAPSLTFALQALLVRHEAYMADSERDRAELTSRIVQLETDKKELEAMNAKTIEENRLLLDQLEELNNSVVESDSRIHLLEASLQASEQAVRRLEITASRAADMERHIAALEQDLEQAQTSLMTTEEETRSASKELMERGAREEKERQAEIVERMERQREIEKELSTAAGRLKGAAAAKSLGTGVPGSTNTVVSHFVRDLLQDNASLQLGIAELRELLANSSDEIQALRDCLALHQPIHDSPSNLMAVNLSTELGSQSRPYPGDGSVVNDSEAEPSVRWSRASNLVSEFGVSTLASSPRSNPRLSMFSGSVALDSEGDDGDGDDSSSTRTTTGRDGQVVDFEQSGILDGMVTPPRPPLRRTVSHESIMSLSGGLDIHTLKTRPSQLTLCQLGSAQAIVTGITAQPTLSTLSGKRGAAFLRDSLAALPSPSPQARAISNPATSFGTLGRWRGWRPWGGNASGGGATANGSEVRNDNGNNSTTIEGDSEASSTSTAQASDPTAPSKALDRDNDKDLLRAPGINQPGAIPGFQQYWASQRRRGAPSKVQPDTVDRAALQDILEHL
ncbi:unnamed protein product [Parascedosporium putredinis]|uniref:Uncharacterized protein n=1 Tax=Parascedosporium putredinis TaxID=1442378 RepID=A0A9P1H422_9PEZI|nr:unnamed protein product [Parascedosporium putredinis]CAI7995264.1 unnamed protein product [Parascedosporium putredinis]